MRKKLIFLCGLTAISLLLYRFVWHKTVSNKQVNLSKLAARLNDRDAGLGYANAELIATEDHNEIDYQMYLEAFRYLKEPENRRNKAGLEFIANFLLSNESVQIQMTTRTALNKMLFRELATYLSGIAMYQKLDDLAFGQLAFLKLDRTPAPETLEFLKDYAVVLIALRKDYFELFGTQEWDKPVTQAKLLRVLATLEVFYGETMPGLAEKFRSFITAHPEGGRTRQVYEWYSQQLEQPSKLKVDIDWRGTLHAIYLKEAHTNKIDILFLGDSLTLGWSQDGMRVWARNFAPLHAANFGVGGDKIQNVLWRIENGELNGLAPRVVVLQIGTNNLTSDSVEEILARHDHFLNELQRRLPSSKILLLGVFPRDDKESLPFRAKIAPVNEGLKRLAAKSDKLTFLDIGTAFRSSYGGISRDVCPDGLHFTEKGYQLWAKAMMPTFRRLYRMARQSPAN